MTPLLRFLLIGLALLLMGARDLPRPCIGDGQGNPCAVERCQCTALCSCRSSCGPEDAGKAAEAAPPSEHASCHMQGADGEGGSATHFSLPEPPAPALMASAITLCLTCGRSPGEIACEAFDSRSLSQPEPPPRRHV